MLFRLGILLASAVFFSAPIHAASGDLDTSFDNDGKVTFQYEQSISSPGIRTANAVQADGKILFAGVGMIPVLGGSTDGYMIFRYNSNGSPDTTFGTNGIVRISVGNFEGVATLLIQPDGKIILTGERYAGTNATDFAVLRFNPDGTPDNSFDGNGLAVANIVGVSNERVGFGVLQPDGKIVVAGPTDLQTSDASYDWSVVRFNTDGSLDSTFDGDGKMTLSLGGDREYLYSAALQQDGKIIVSGVSSNGTDDDFTTVRLNTNGSIDPSFGVGGVVKTPVGTANDFVYDVEVLTDGRILAVGGTLNGANNDVALVRYTNDGGLDLSFGTGGILVDSSSANESASAAAIHGDGRIVITTASGGNSAAIRYNSNGSRDPSFGFNGKVSTQILNFTSGVPYSLSIQSDGKIVVSGAAFWQTSPGPTYFYSLRYLTNGSLAVNFDYDGDGRADLSLRRPTDNIWYLLQGTAGFTAITWGVAGDRMAPADYDGDGKTDVAVFRPSTGQWFVVNSSNLTFVTYNWGQDGDLPVPTDRDNDGRTDLVLFRPSNNTWYPRSTATGPLTPTQFGEAGDKPMVGDFDADGIGDIALFRPSNNNWYIIKSSLGFFVQTWGEAGDIPTTGDFDGDGATDQAVFRPSTGQWYLSRTTAGFSSQFWGQNGDVPVAADYDGDGKTDVAVFRPGNATWYIVNSTAGIQTTQFGQTGDVPTQSSFIY